MSPLFRRAGWTVILFVYLSALSTCKMDVAYSNLPTWYVDAWRWIATHVG